MLVEVFEQQERTNKLKYVASMWHVCSDAVLSCTPIPASISEVCETCCGN